MQQASVNTLLSAKNKNTLFLENTVIVFLWESQRFFLIPLEFSCFAVYSHCFFFSVIKIYKRISDPSHFASFQTETETAHPS